VTYLHHVQKITEISKPTTQRWEFIYTTASTNSNHQQMCSAQKAVTGDTSVLCIYKLVLFQCLTLLLDRINRNICTVSSKIFPDETIGRPRLNLWWSWKTIDTVGLVTETAANL